MTRRVSWDQTPLAEGELIQQHNEVSLELNLHVPPFTQTMRLDCLLAAEHETVSAAGACALDWRADACWLAQNRDAQAHAEVQRLWIAQH